MSSDTRSSEGTRNTSKCEIVPQTEQFHCLVCNSNVNDPVKYGDGYKYADISVHYFCLLFSSNLIQNGEDHDGILGFYPKDIRKEIKRGSRLLCSYCRKKGATIGCSLKSCKRSFHFPCGVKKGSLHQFFNQFLSFCHVHRPVQKVDGSCINSSDEDSKTCPICYDAVCNKVSNETLWAPCCRKRWFHRYCIQRQALAQGYFFKCPLCNNKEQFTKEMRNLGIYIPDMDAAWEREPNAYHELLESYRHCDARHCKCPDGRNFGQNIGSWRLLNCNACGSQGTHIACSGLSLAALTNSWRCSVCSCIGSTQTTRRDIPAVRPLSPPRAESPAQKRRKSEAAEQSKLLVQDDQQPGPSRDSNSEDDIIVVDDDVDDDIEIVGEVKSTCSTTRQYSVPHYVDKELLTKEGKKIKVHKVTANDSVPGEVGNLGIVNLKAEEKTVPRTTLPGKEEACSSGLKPTPNSVFIGENSFYSTLPRPVQPSSDSRITQPLDSSGHQRVQGSLATPSGPSPSAAAVCNPPIRINNIRHSDELFSSNRAQEVQSRGRSITTGATAGLPPQLPSQNQSLPHSVPPSIIWVPCTVGGQAAVQPMVITYPSIPTTVQPIQQRQRQQQQQQQQQQLPQEPQTPDIIYLE